MPLSAPRVVFSASSQPSFSTGADGVLLEIVAGAAVLLADHVQVALQDDAGLLFPARAAGLADHQVADAVLFAGQAPALSPGRQVVAQGGFVLGLARNGAECGEMAPHGDGLQVGEGEVGRGLVGGDAGGEGGCGRDRGGGSGGRRGGRVGHGPVRRGIITVRPVQH